jgi:hypothetical protein
VATRVYKVMLWSSTGIHSASLGEGIQVIQSGSTYRLEVAPVAHSLVSHNAGVFVIPRLITLIRSGLVLTEGVDYERTADGARLTLQGWDVEDTWSALCR